MKGNILYKTIRPYMHLLLTGIALAFAASSVSVYIANYVRNMTDALTSHIPIYLQHMILPIAAAILVSFFANYLRERINSYLSINVLKDIKNVLAKKLIHIKYSEVESAGSGSVLTRFNTDIGEVNKLVSHWIPDIIGETIRFAIVAVYMLFINWQLLLITVTILPLSFFLIKRIGERMNVAMQNRLQSIDASNQTVRDIIEGITTERAYNLQEKSIQRMADAHKTQLFYEYERLDAGLRMAFIHGILGWTPIFVTGVAGAYFAFSGWISAGAMVAFFLLIREISRPMQGIPHLVVEIRQSLVSVKRLDELANAPDEPGGTLTGGSDLKTAIAWNGVHFSYVPEKPVLINCSLTIPVGMNAAFVGSSGCGKTTIFKLLTGMYEISSGSYTFYGHPFTDWDISHARNQFAFVSQDIFLFPESIAENVSYGKPDASLEDIKQCCRLAGIHDFITSLPEGYDTQVGERGLRLSGGECQRLSIARAFLKDAPILLLDEPTAALDGENELKLQQSIESLSKGRTVLTIAHRLSTIQNADKIFVMDAGHIVESGMHHALMAHNGVYAALYTKQMRSEADSDGQ